MAIDTEGLLEDMNRTIEYAMSEEPSAFRRPTLIVNNQSIRDHVKKSSDMINKAIEDQVHRMVDLGYDLAEIEVRTTNVSDGLNIQVRSKTYHREASRLEVKLGMQFYRDDVYKKLAKQFESNIDISPYNLSDILTGAEIKDLHAKLYNADLLRVTCDLFHNCSDEPVSHVIVHEGREKPAITECPGCGKKIQLGTSWWGGYRYMLDKDEWEKFKVSRQMRSKK